MQNPVFRFLSSLRLAAALLVIFAVAAGTATWIESYYAGIGSTETGRAAAYDLVYDALWFNSMLILLFVNLLLNLVSRLARKRQKAGFLLVHVGMLVILVGAGITRWFGFEGYLRIREGESNNVVSSAQTFAVVRDGASEAAVPIRLYRPGAQGIHKTVTVGDARLTLGVDEYWPRFERTMVPGEDGRAMVTLGAMGSDGLQMHTLYEGDEARLGPVLVRFHREGLPPTEEMSGRYGVLRVRAGDEICRLPVTADSGLLGACGGWTFELTEFQSDFHTGGESDPDGPLLNPMVRVAVTNPGGEVAEKMLFALHPDFGLMHEESALLQAVDLVYEVSSGIDLARQDDGIVMRASFPLEVAPMMAEGEGRSLTAGEVVPVEKQMIYRSADGFRVVPTAVEMSVVAVPSVSENPNAPAAARLYVERDGERAEAICMHHGGPQRVTLGGRELTLTYGSVMHTLPYSLYLEDFLLETYPGSDNPASYESLVVLEDPDRGITGENVRIWMNHPLNHRGTKHFQSSYDRDRLGTVLSVNRDPGKVPTYVGYTILTLGFLLIMGRIIGERGQARGRNGLMVVLAAVLLAATVVTPHAALAQRAADEPPALTLSPDALDAASRLIVQDFRGRMKPLDTLARETAIKITKKGRFEGREPVAVFLGFVVHSAEWYHHPTLAVKNPGVQDLLGVGRDIHHVSLASVLEGGQYKLQSAVEEAHRTPANMRSKTQQKLIGFDERVHLLYSALQGGSLRIFPVPDDPINAWQDIETVLEAVAEDDTRRAEFVDASEALLGGLQANDDLQIRDGLRRTAALQQKYGASVIPKGVRLDSELRLNSLHPFARSTVPYMLAFVLLIIAYFVGLFRRDSAPWRWRDPLFAVGMVLYIAGFALHLYGFVLRWIASGRAPLSNGHESLLWVALAVALAGILFELGSRTAAAGALGSLLTAVVLGVSMMSMFDPAIGPLVPVLASYWLNIHVTIITASYGFLGLSCLLGLLTMLLLIVAALSRRPVAAAVTKLDKLNIDVMIAGLGMLAVGTLLGGVWANESWGRYWGWDPKETWALVSVLIYAVILHFRWLPKLANPFVHAAGSFLAIWSIIMTYFGVNYLLVGLHSYAAGDAVTVPTWVVVAFMAMLALTLVAYFAWLDVSRRRRGGAEVASRVGRS